MHLYLIFNLVDYLPVKTLAQPPIKMIRHFSIHMSGGGGGIFVEIFPAK